MKCALLPLGYDGQKYRHKCQVPGCGREVRTYESDPRRISVQCGWKAAPKEGPGTELKKIIEQLGVSEFRDCGCLAMVRKMNKWGIDGCREHRQEIIDKLKANAKEYGWWCTVTAGCRAVKTGMALELDPRDRFGSLVDLAIRRSEAAVLNPS